MTSRIPIPRPAYLLSAIAACLALAVLATPASALRCGSTGQLPCVEAPPPGVELRLKPAENPHKLKPLAQAPSPSRPLWPRVRGHKPYGFNAVSAGKGQTTIADEVHLHREIGASMAGILADWAMIQYYPNAQESGGRPWNYERHLDEEYKAYVAQGIRPLLGIVRTPRRFTNNADTPQNSDVTGCGTSDACWNPPRTDALDRLAIFAADLAKRYPLAAGIEVWNEPNLSHPFWGGEPADPVRYTEVLRTVHAAVKKVRPNMPVIGGAVAPVGEAAQSSKAVGIGPYVEGMLRAGAAEHMDAISYHPYLGAYPTWTSDPHLQQTALFWAMVTPHAEVRDAYRRTGVPMNERVAITEFGASTTNGFTPQQQSDWLLYQFYFWDIEHPNVPLSDRTDAVFAHRSVEIHGLPESNMWQSGYGFTKAKNPLGSFETKPVYCTFRTMFGGFDSCPAAITPAGP